MMPLNFYEITGLVVPGATALVGMMFVMPYVRDIFLERPISGGEFGVLLLGSYALGHLIQGLGNILEAVWWWAWGGWPTDWVKGKNRRVLAACQLEALSERVRGEFGIDLGELSPGILRQIYSCVRAAGRSYRVDTFNANYALCRGIAAAFVLLLATMVVTHGLSCWKAYLIILLLETVAIYRMHRFAVHYARELFVEFLGSSHPLNQDARTRWPE